MRLATLLAVLVFAAPAAFACATDGDCRKGLYCLSQKTACPDHPESSTCVERVCRHKPAEDADRVCKADSDCAVVVQDCRCMYCAQPADYALGVVVAVNKKRTKPYAALAKCTEAQTKLCAQAGACAMTGTMEPRCLDKRCVAEFKPRP